MYRELGKQSKSVEWNEAVCWFICILGGLFYWVLIKYDGIIMFYCGMVTLNWKQFLIIV